MTYLYIEIDSFVTFAANERRLTQSRTTAEKTGLSHVMIKLTYMESYRGDSTELKYNNFIVGPTTFNKAGLSSNP